MRRTSGGGVCIKYTIGDAFSATVKTFFFEVLIVDSNSQGHVARSLEGERIRLLPACRAAIITAGDH